MVLAQTNLTLSFCVLGFLFMNKVSSDYSHPVFTPTPAGSQFNESALVGRHGQNRNQRRFQNSDRADNYLNNSQQQSRFQQNRRTNDRGQRSFDGPRTNRDGRFQQQQQRLAFDKSGRLPSRCQICKKIGHIAANSDFRYSRDDRESLSNNFASLHLASSSTNDHTLPYQIDSIRSGSA